MFTLTCPLLYHYMSGETVTDVCTLQGQMVGTLCTHWLPLCLYEYPLHYSWGFKRADFMHGNFGGLTRIYACWQISPDWPQQTAEYIHDIYCAPRNVLPSDLLQVRLIHGGNGKIHSCEQQIFNVYFVSVPFPLSNMQHWLVGNVTSLFLMLIYLWIIPALCMWSTAETICRMNFRTSSSSSCPFLQIYFISSPPEAGMSKAKPSYFVF